MNYYRITISTDRNGHCRVVTVRAGTIKQALQTVRLAPGELISECREV